MKKDINIGVLENVFQHKSTSYKYYWALSLLDLVKNGRSKCSINEVVIGMMLRAWEMAIVENRSIGGQDRLYERIREINDVLKISETKDIEDIRNILCVGLRNAEVRRIFVSLEGNVPYRFLSPWIEPISNNEIERLSRNYENGCPYGIWKDVIVMNPSWKEYLIENNERLQKSVEDKLNEYLNK